LDSPMVMNRVFIAKDGGFTSVGVVVAMMLAITLLFTSMQVYWLRSQAPDIQFAADAGALAAEKVVSQYTTIARIADATVMSMSLFGMSLHGVAIVVSCIPSMQSVGVKLTEFAQKVLQARDKLSKSSATALNQLQKALPFVCAVNASAAIAANSTDGITPAQYAGIAIVLPLDGQPVNASNSKDMIKAGDDLADQNADTAKLTDAAKEAEKKMQASKLAGFKADCGDAPANCQYERASSLVQLSPSQNPMYQSVEHWTFDVAYARAQAYYKARLSAEQPKTATLDEQIKSFARKRFYHYAINEFAKGHCTTAANGVLDADFPEIPKTAIEARKTSIYTEGVYPVDADGVMHGVGICSKINGTVTYKASIKDLESGAYESCETCNLSSKNLAQVGSITANAPSGFEYHYFKVVEAAKKYKAASKDYEKEFKAAKNSAKDAFETFEDAFSKLKTTRITPHPPGRSGAIAIAFDLSSHKTPEAFGRAFVGGDTELSPRMAISGAALAEDKASFDNNILANFLDGAKAEMGTQNAAGMGLGVFDGVLSIWGCMLMAYNGGVDAVRNGVGDFLNSLPIIGQTPLGGWAKDALSDVLDGLGLTAVNLSSLKPVLVNTQRIIQAADEPITNGIAKAYETYMSIPGEASGTLSEAAFDGMLLTLEQRSAETLDSEFTIFTLSFGEGLPLPQIPIKIKLPEQVSARGKGLVGQAIQSLRNIGGANDAQKRIWQ
jgi:hypothetical protein